MPNKADELKVEYARLVGRMRELNDAAEADERDLTAEELAEYEQLNVEATSARNRVVREQDLRSRELGVDTDEIDPRQMSEELTADVEDTTEMYATTFGQYVRFGHSSLDADQRKLLQTGFRAAADQMVGTPALGGYIVPEEFRAQLIEFLTQQSVLRQAPTTKIVTSSGNTMLIPRLVDVGEAFLVAEAAEVPHSPIEFDQVQIQAWKYGRLVTISIELLEDSVFDIAGLLGRKIGGSIGALEEEHFMNGVGTNQPEGLLPNITAGATTTSAGAVEGDDLIDLYFSVTSPYRRNGSWVISESALAPIRKLKDGNERYLLDVASGSSLGGQAVDTLLGRPVWVSPDVGDFSSEEDAIAIFGDLSHYWIRDVGRSGPVSDEMGGGDVLIRRLEERYAEFGMVGFIGFHRTDGRYIGDPAAVKYLANPST